jgi:hypothetical protein
VVGLVTIGLLLLGIVGIQLRFFLRRRAQQRTTWNMLLARIEPLNFSDLEKIAKAYLDPRGNQLELQPQAMWRLLGGTDGLPRLRRNAQVMLDLAVFVQRWNFEDATVVAEIMRRDAARLQKAITQIEMAMLLRRQSLRIPFYIHEASAAYYLMRQRLLALYETSHVGLLPRLTQAL